MAKDNTWYIAITGFGGCYFSLVAAGSQYFGDFAKHHNEAGASKIIAEQFGVSPELVNKITGFNESDRPTKEVPLKNLVDKLNNGEELDIQKELSKLCAA